MGYYTAMPYKSTKYGKSIWSDGKFVVFEWQDRLFLFLNDFEIACLISGRQGLDKYFKGSFLNWIEKVRLKDLKKADGMAEKAQKVLEEVEEIRKMWE